jgi:hypothetical protein
MPEVSLPAVEGYRFASLTEAEQPAVQALLERCADYLELVAGLPLEGAHLVGAYLMPRTA